MKTIWWLTSQTGLYNIFSAVTQFEFYTIQN